MSVWTVTVSPAGQFTTSGTVTFDRTPAGDATAAATAAIISEGSAQSEVFASTAGTIQHFPNLFWPFVHEM